MAAGFTQNGHDYSLFTLKKDADNVVILVYVDDLLITGSNTKMINEAKENLHKHFKLKGLGELRYFLGIKVLRSAEGVLLNQTKYVLKLFQNRSNRC